MVTVAGLAAWWRGHRKAVIAVAGALVSLAVALAPASKWVSLAAAVAAAAGVYRVPNTHEAAASPPRNRRG